MRVRGKALLIVLVTWASLLAVLYFGLADRLRLRFLEVEDTEVRRSLDRPRAVLQGVSEQLGRTTKDYASWDDTYAFIEDGNAAYIGSNLVGATFANLHLNLMLFARDRGRPPAYGGWRPNGQQQPGPLPPELAASLQAMVPWLTEHSRERPVHGWVILSGHLLLIGAARISDSESTAPPRGLLVFGRLFLDEDFEEVARQSGLDLRAGALTGLWAQRRFARFEDELLRRGSAVEPLDDVVTGYTLLHDLQGRPALLLGARGPRTIVAAGRSSRASLLLAVALPGLGFGLVCLGLLEVVVLRRLGTLSQQVARIRNSGGVGRLQIGGRDELQTLAESINGMLDTIDRTVREQHRVEESLRQAQKLEAVGRLAAGIAHDFNNILQTVTGHASYLRLECSSSGPFAGELDQILKASSRAAGLVRQLLSFSRQGKLELASLDVSRQLDELVRLMRRSIPSSIQISVPPPAGPLRVDADPVQLQQVLLNLCVNAIDAMPEGGTLTLQVECPELGAGEVPIPDAAPGGYVCISVSDTGQGIPRELLPRIFEPFFTTKGAGQGTGLGLATVYGIVRQHGGFVTVRSELGAGTSFSVFLPRSVAEPPRREVARTLPPPPVERGHELVLVADDEPAIRHFLVRTLQRAGYRVLAAADGQEVLRLFEAQPTEVELVLLDAHMPGLDGLHCAEALRAGGHGPRVVLLSGDGAPSELHHADIDAFLEKPIGAQQLLSELRRVLDGTPPRLLRCPVAARGRPSKSVAVDQVGGV